MTTTIEERRPRALPGELLIEADSVTKTFSTPEGELPVLDGVSLQVHAGEVVALLGKSGSGKSTLLRAIAGLLTPTAGTISHHGQRLVGPNPGTAMVFQSFALLPWLTVRQNVELGLEAKGVDRARRRDRAERAIDLIGLDGFEDAYPKELSGGMRQRVGFARALVVEPEVLLMDEPFSALDVLTAENLRGELMELWGSDEFPIESIVLVTHNIEEAVLLADRVVILGSNPGRIKLELPIGLARPRDRHDPSFEQLVNRIYEVMTGRLPADVVAPMAATPASVPLPHATVDGLSGLAELLAGRGRQPIADTAEQLTFEVDDLLPVVDALELLGFASVEHGSVELTEPGRTFAGADIQASKQMFARAVLQHAPLVRAIANDVAREADGTLKARVFRDVLRRSFSDGETQVQLDVASDWGRYAEQFSYDADHDEFLTDPDRDRVLLEGDG
ncbi:MAG TPA: nitrate/sulfonate/bicarbonate ABC transporter ATP-binding protein [Acidimicrobiales bacterium]|nr:nitrate/sulfonate/bicarbonate ABC transporter ATP-binding protein [Acidimicrobiales bacterium]